MQIDARRVHPSRRCQVQRQVRQWGGPQRSFFSGRAQGPLLTDPRQRRLPRIPLDPDQDLASAFARAASCGPKVSALLTIAHQRNYRHLARRARRAERR
jgi:hypothetical protein